MQDKKVVALYPGSFDPFTNGHLHVIETASKLFAEVIVNIGDNKEKKRHYKRELMKKAMEEVFKERGLTNVRVMMEDGATVKLAMQEHVDIIVKGIRNETDREYEENQAFANYMASGIDTIFIRAGIAGNISSSLVRDFVYYGFPIEELVPGPIKKLIYDNKDI